MDLATYAAHGIVPKRRDLLTGIVYRIDFEGVYIEPEEIMPADIFIAADDLDHFNSPDVNLGDVVTAMVMEPEDDQGRIVGSLSLAQRQIIVNKLPELAEQNDPITVVIGKVSKSKQGKVVGLVGLTQTDIGAVEAFVPYSKTPTEYRGDLHEAVGQEFQGQIVGTGESNLVVDLGPSLGFTRNFDAAEDVNPGDRITAIVEQAVSGGYRILLANGAPAWVPDHEVDERQRGKLTTGSTIKGIVLKRKRRTGDVPIHMRWNVIVSLRSNAEWTEFDTKTSKGEFMVAEVKKIVSGRNGDQVLARPEGWTGVVGIVNDLKRLPEVGEKLIVMRGNVQVDRRRLWLSAEVPLSTRK